MYKISNPMRNENASRLKPLLLFVLMGCFVLSACSVRKGIQSFFAEVSPVAATSVKASKICTASLNSADGNLLFKQDVTRKLPTALVLFFLLPDFLLSVFFFKKDKYLAVPSNPDLSATAVPLFIKNRLLLI
ncbi:hypothetical protein HQN84_31390 [Pedobacter steynii]|nr:hypothetical protein [Pedobacter steynii]NQX43395.1 hypothetical protein [Pedobacter steynii]